MSTKLYVVQNYHSMFNAFKEEFSVRKLSFDLNHGDSIHESRVGYPKVSRM